MSRGDASGHLAKAREFLDAASAAHDAGQHSAAASSAVVAGINAKDTICLVLTGTLAGGLHALTAARPADHDG